MSDAKVAGLAKQMRSQTEKSDEYDLDNYSEQAAAELAAAAFAQPFDVDHAVRCSLVIGGGKGIRGRYDPNLARGLAQALKALGFEEDSGASLGAAGAFKHQHDTGRNIKVLHVFPHTQHEAQGAGGGEAAGDAHATLDADSPAYQLLAADSLDAFVALAEAHLPAYAQRQRCLRELQAVYLPLFKSIDDKLVSAQPLSPAEEGWSAVCSADALQERLAWLQKAMADLVKSGQLTGPERGDVVKSTAAKLEAVQVEIATARSQGKDKRADKLEVTAKQLQELHDAADKAKAIEPRAPADALSEVATAYRQILALRNMEARAKADNKLLSIEQARQVGQIPELQDKMRDVIAAHRGWFEDQEEVAARFAPARAAAQAAQKKAQAQQQARANANAGWSSVGGNSSKHLSRPAGGASKGRGGGGSGGAFALLGESDM
mmetsp:Transcript_7198/g.19577  ORF Transcript_7198/g.19577 Transcript_7198/m.19577 type:complete len:434 (-) Transcript_7198:308-1609(-)|eukprot:CAMPEP_0185193292 /NCGR_PEP_ID=MMETSP1140-20130426/24767_1 /TAXON_ID=298111 /ORGANISM="Pavlova sp., Strain CCMP459" /LENGTH=433 /DNA_ID=CAMNT_0027760097 /DNA_START=68 /DNA_END=1369 /DNA_ORIENTATION=+